MHSILAVGNLDTNRVMPVEREGTQVCKPVDKAGSSEMEDNALLRLEALRKVNGNPSWVNRDLYRMLYKPNLYKLAYERIKSSPGNMTPGADKETLDGFSMQVVEKIIKGLKDESFQFARARKVPIPKANGGTRDLGVASPRDKIVQEAIRLILESIYDSPYGSSFSDRSFGFRQGMGTHTALQHINQEWQGAAWFVEGDIKGCFDNIDHHRLIEILRLRISDERFINLIWKALTAGYLEFKVPVNSIVGTPQGSIISPILANIYMHQLDVFVDNLRLKYEKASSPKYAREYADNNNALRRLRRALTKAEDEGKQVERERIADEIRKLKVLATTLPVWDPDTLPIRIRYVRYADDWLIGLNGKRELAEKLRDEVEEFLASDLKLTLSREKTHIRHSKTEEAFFLGTRIKVGSKHPRVLTFSRKEGDGDHVAVTKRTTSGQVSMFAPIDRIISRLYQKGFCKVNGDPIAKVSLVAEDDIRIIESYNSLLLGYLNYYSFVTNRPNLRRIAYILQFSAAKTLANRHRTSMREIFRKHGYMLTVSITGSSGVVKTTNLRYPLEWKANTRNFLTGSRPDALEVIKAQTSALTRTKIDKHCCICGGSDGVAMHHVRHVRRNGKNTNEGFDKLMGKINRKQIPVCSSCHSKIHNGRYDGISLMDFADVHLAAR